MSSEIPYWELDAATCDRLSREIDVGADCPAIVVGIEVDEIQGAEAGLIVGIKVDGRERVSISVNRPGRYGIRFVPEGRQVAVLWQPVGIAPSITASAWLGPA